MRRGTLRRTAVAAVVVASGLVGLPHGGATATTTGEGFDACDALPTSAMRSVTGYAAAAIYIGGDNAACKTQSQLSPSWVSTVTGAGWTLIPTFVGKQAPCTTGFSVMGSNPSAAAADGTADADTAASRMSALGLNPPAVVYDDMEAYNPADAGCAADVAAYLDAFIAGMHGHGFRAGVYGSTASTIAQLVSAYGNSSRQRPDDLWIAHPGGGDTTADSAVPAAEWAGHRIRQYAAGSLVPPSGDPSSVSIDSDAVAGDTAVGTGDALPPAYVVSGTGSLGYVRERSTPSTTGTDVTHDSEGTALSIVCQTAGDSIAGDPVWDKLADSNYVSDLYTTSPGGLSYAGTLPRCDATATARITSPANGTQVLAGSTVTVHVDVPVPATSVEVATSTDHGNSWHTAGASNSATAGLFTVTFAAPVAVGATVLLQATVSGSGTTWSAVNTPALHVVAPVATMAAAPSATTAAVYTVGWSGLDGAGRPTSYDVRYQRAPWNGTFGGYVSPTGWTGTTSTSKALSLAEGFDYCVQARAHGVFGDVGQWSPVRCVARVLDDRAMTAGIGWSRGTSSGYYDRTWSSTKSAGAALTRTGATVSRVGILATTCAACGSVGVYVGNTVVGTISLVAPHTRLQQLLTVPSFRLRSGTVTVRVRTSGKLVQIDGLLLSRT
jgi:hypothetical protein